MYVGEGEAALRDAFSRARLAAPSILFFDELDSIVGGWWVGGCTSPVSKHMSTQYICMESPVLASLLHTAGVRLCYLCLLSCPSTYPSHLACLAL